MTKRWQHLDLFVPEWQGYGVDNRSGLGAWHLRRTVFGEIPFQEVEIAVHEELELRHGILGFDAVRRTLCMTRNAILAAQHIRFLQRLARIIRQPETSVRGQHGFPH